MKRLALSLACLGLLVPTLKATSITYVGVEAGNGAAENWSNPAVAKTYDLNGDDRFGGAGYYQIMPAADDANFGSSWSFGVGDGNDLGITITETPPNGISSTLKFKPNFLVDNPTGGAGSCFIFSTNPIYSNPLGNDVLRQGALAVSITDFDVSAKEGEIFGSSANAFTFTLSEAAHVRIGIAVDTDGYYAPDYVSVFNESTGEEFSDPLSRNGLSDMAFFDIEGIEGEVFTVKLWQTNSLISVDGPIAFALITFDQLPPPPTPTLSYVQEGSSFTLSWEQNIPGWILESSTDLGSADDWDPVSGVVNNSVTLDMTGVPKNFFRLRKDP